MKRINTRLLFPDSTGKPGRPRTFDTGLVLLMAGQLFWEKGYHATSIEDLCAATGVLRGSLYGAFGDKRGILLAALKHYGEERVKRLAVTLNYTAPDMARLRGALRYYTKTASDPTGRGCLITNTAMEMIPQDKDVTAIVDATLRRMSALLAKEVVRYREAGLLRSDLNETTAGNFLLALAQGMRVVNKVFREEELGPVVDLALAGLQPR